MPVPAAQLLDLQDLQLATQLADIERFIELQQLCLIVAGQRSGRRQDEQGNAQLLGH